MYTNYITNIGKYIKIQGCFFCSGMSIEYIQSRNQHCFLAINNFAE